MPLAPRSLFAELETKPRKYHPQKIKLQIKLHTKLVAVLAKDALAPWPVPRLPN
jgi:hypothetical protein